MPGFIEIRFIYTFGITSLTCKALKALLQMHCVTHSLTSKEDVSLVGRSVQQILEVINIHTNKGTCNHHGTHNSIRRQRSSNCHSISISINTHLNSSNVGASTGRRQSTNEFLQPKQHCILADREGMICSKLPLRNWYIKRVDLVSLLLEE